MLETLPALSPAELRSEWRRLYRSQPPRLSRDLLIRAIAYRIQELRYGGLSKATGRKLAALMNARQSEAEIAPETAQKIRAGARLVREWNGRTHTVTVKEEGFTYAGRSYRSLTAIAREITGAHWSGPRFFGLARRSCTTASASRRRPLERAWKGALQMSSRSAVGTRRATKVRCAIYTRKSSEEGLEQDFNSLDAQREACEAFILQPEARGLGGLPELYDDGGISGGTWSARRCSGCSPTSKPAGVDIVVVYKVDRLTRSLIDFAKIVEVFDRHAVSFVSVTQQFNTTTSMGRLTLNMLLSFAQFEREVTGERIRDKIAASKKKGMWMGGLPAAWLRRQGPEAGRQRGRGGDGPAHLPALCRARLGPRAQGASSTRDGIVSKARVDKYGRSTGGKPLARGALYLMLQNRIYRGEIVHKDNSYPGEHDADHR